MASIGGISTNFQSAVANNPLEKGNFGFAKGVLQSGKNGEVGEAQYLENVSKAVATPRNASVGLTTKAGGLAGEVNAARPSFGEMFSDFVKKIDAPGKEYKEEVHKILTGESTNIHRAQILKLQTTVGLKFLVETRNAVMEGYRELMRMQI